MRRRALAGAALAVLAVPVRSEDYAGPGEALDAIDTLEAEVGERLASLADRVPGARDLLRSVRAAHARHARERARLRRRRGLPPPRPAIPAARGPGSLRELREAQDRLVYAHAESVPVLSPAEVAVVTSHLVVVSRHLTVIDLWMDQERPRG